MNSDRGRRILLALLSGALFFSALGLQPIWWLAWVAPVPVMVAAARAGSREARWLAWLAAAMGLASLFIYYSSVLPVPAVFVLLLLQILAWGFYVMTARSAMLSGTQWWKVFMYPLTVAGMDLLIGWLSPHGTWGSYAYTQMDAAAVVQVASVAGTPGVVFVVALAQSVMAMAWYRAGRVERPMLAYGLPLVLVAAAVGFGAWRMSAAETASVVKVGIGSIDDWIGDGATAELREKVWRGYEEMVKGMAVRGARIVVLPEKIGALDVDEAARRWETLARVAREAGVYVVAGAQVNGAQRKDNVLWVFHPKGESTEEYRKQRLVPGLESDLTPGTEYKVARMEGTAFGLAICRDLLFRDFGREYGRRGVVAVVAPAWDFHRDAWMASAVAAMRGVEGGYAVVRAGRESYLHVSDRFGRVIARLPSAELPGKSMVTELQLGQGEGTPYAQWGDVFGWLCVAGAVAVRWKAR